jgi:hypothetical protein
MGKKKDEGQPPPPVVRVAPLGELKAYIVSEHELESLARGAVVSDLLTIGYSLLAAALTLLATMLSTTLPQLQFVLFFCALLIFTIAGGICLFIGYRTRESVKALVNAIRNRMPPPQAIRAFVVQDGIQITEQASVRPSTPPSPPATPPPA